MASITPVGNTLYDDLAVGGKGMGQVYLVGTDGRSEPMERIRCKNEDQELQRLLESNFELLPGDQIDPDEPRRWLLVKREMPVPDPSTGSDRWSIDFFFVDQD